MKWTNSIGGIALVVMAGVAAVPSPSLAQGQPLDLR
jgi:hypothetical protein